MGEGVEDVDEVVRVAAAVVGFWVEVDTEVTDEVTVAAAAATGVGVHGTGLIGVITGPVWAMSAVV